MVSLGKSKAVSALRRKQTICIVCMDPALIHLKMTHLGILRRSKGEREGNCSGKSFFQFCLRAVTEGRKKLMVDRDVCGFKLSMISFVHVVGRKGLCWCFLKRGLSSDWLRGDGWAVARVHIASQFRDTGFDSRDSALDGCCHVSFW
jgi:hypothetical protein